MRATPGISDRANLGDGDTWPTSYALRKVTAAEENGIAAFVQRAVT